MTKTKSQKVEKKASNPSASGLFENIENFLNKNYKGIFIFSLSLTAFFSFILFNARISEGGDDSNYIYGGYKYATDFKNYSFTFQAPLYPFFLSLFIKAFGLKLLMLKMISLVSNFFGMFFLFKAFKNRIPALVLVPTILMLAINTQMHYYASQTYTEAFYFLIFSLFFYLCFNGLTKIESEDLKSNLKYLALIGFLTFVITETKNISIAAVPSILLFLLIIKKWKEALTFAGIFAVLKLGFTQFRKLLGTQNDQYTGQSNILWLKDPYAPAKGTEDLSGFITRFIENIDLYLSKNMLKILGFVDEYYPNNHTLMSWFLVAVFVGALFLAFRNKQHYLLLSGLVVMSMAAASFIVLQTRWDQPRLIMIYMPVLLILFFYLLHELLKNKSFVLQSLYFYIFIFLFGGGILNSLNQSKDNLTAVRKNLSGDLYYGYTPDWINFLKMSEWCGKNLPAESLVASRKHSMSFVYANGKEFFPVYQVQFTDSTTNMSNPDSALAYFQKNKVTHLILANLRRNPKVNDGYIINTIHRMVYPIAQKYPDKVKVLHTIGNSEQAQLVELKY